MNRLLDLLNSVHRMRDNERANRVRSQMDLERVQIETDYLTILTQERSGDEATECRMSHYSVPQTKESENQQTKSENKQCWLSFSTLGVLLTRTLYLQNRPSMLPLR